MRTFTARPGTQAVFLQTDLDETEGLRALSGLRLDGSGQRRQLLDSRGPDLVARDNAQIIQVCLG